MQIPECLLEYFRVRGQKKAYSYSYKPTREESKLAMLNDFGSIGAHIYNNDILSLVIPVINNIYEIDHFIMWYCNWYW